MAVYLPRSPLSAGEGGALVASASQVEVAWHELVKVTGAPALNGAA